MNAFHLVFNSHLLLTQLVLRRLMEFIKKLALFLELLLQFCDLYSQLIVITSQIVEFIRGILDSEVFRPAYVERRLSHKYFLPNAECVLC